MYELALMTAREVAGMGIDEVELTVVTAEPTPLGLLGPHASCTLRDELAAAGVRLETASIDREHRPRVVLQPSGRRIDAERVLALPALAGADISGTTRMAHGFIRVDRHGQMLGSTSVWTIGDAAAHAVKLGGMAARQADVAAGDIAARAGAITFAVRARRGLAPSLLTGAGLRPLDGRTAGAGAHGVVTGTPDKLSAEFLAPVLQEFAALSH